MIDFNLKVFIAVAKTNSFTRAAEFLNLSQPAVTHQIKNLENMFKAKLFIRDQNKIYLTKSGHILLKYAGNIDILYKKAMEEIQEINNMIAGDIQIGTTPIMGKYLLPRILGDFKNTYPDVNLSMLIGNSREIIEFLEKDIIEVAIVSEPITPKNLITFPFYRDYLMVVVYPSHTWCKRKKITSFELFKEDFISREIGSGTREVYTKYLKDIHPGQKLKIAIVLGSTEAVKAGVIGEMGFSIVSRLAAQSEIGMGLLKEVRLQDLEMVREFFIVCKSEKHLSVPSLKLKEYLKGKNI